MRTKRTFFYVRQDVDTPFFHEEYNPDYCEEVDYAVKQIDSCLSFVGGKVNDKIHYFSLIQTRADHELHKHVTHNLYCEGDLKDSFKESMRYTKQHEIAFALGYSKPDQPQWQSYDVWDFYNFKPDDEVFIDATPKQKIAIKLLDATVAQPNFLYIINFFDYKHNVKHVQVKMLDTDVYFWERFSEEQTQIYPTFREDKITHNTMYNIKQGEKLTRGLTDNQGPNYNSHFVHKYLPDDLHTLKLPVLI